MFTFDSSDITTGFITAPADRGQTVEVSYASAPEFGVIRRTVDHSDRTTVYAVASWDNVRGEFEPQNQPPSVKRGAWKKATFASDEG